ncbi:hypothetical protein NQ314_015733 [Rhamnusium bicolor]|uniref:CCHC-type domain-containing protein n=1 Tax=Rhamnusium bicolor TaxID=1586634 RepID=A0AAV8WY48_9CUCU|nr:hypothetical protein NQ314_015733 [Rhamnusium bicolor]
MALIGNIEQFKGNAEEFETYVERVEHLFKVNNVSQEMKVSMFITLAGSEVYQTLRNLAASRKPTELTTEGAKYKPQEVKGKPVKEPGESSSRGRCKRCGRSHQMGRCPAIHWRCYVCSKYGHVAKLCLSKTTKVVGAVEEQGSADEYNGYEEVNSDLLNLNTVRGNETAPYRVLLKLKQKRVAFEVDTGACKSVMSFRRFKEILNVLLKPVTYKLNVVSGQDIKAVGECLVEVQYGGQNYQLFLTIIESNKDFAKALRQLQIDHIEELLVLAQASVIDESLHVRFNLRCECLEKIYVEFQKQHEVIVSLSSIMEAPELEHEKIIRTTFHDNYFTIKTICSNILSGKPSNEAKDNLDASLPFPNSATNNSHTLSSQVAPSSLTVTVAQVHSLTNFLPSKTAILLSTARVEIVDAWGKYQSVRILIDGGSQANNNTSQVVSTPKLHVYPASSVSPDVSSNIVTPKSNETAGATHEGHLVDDISQAVNAGADVTKFTGMPVRRSERPRKAPERLDL